MNTNVSSTAPVPHESWYKYGVAALLLEMGIAIALCSYSLYLTFHGAGGFSGRH
jgi:hypothetical protein